MKGFAKYMAVWVATRILGGLGLTFVLAAMYFSLTLSYTHLNLF